MVFLNLGLCFSSLVSLGVARPIVQLRFPVLHAGTNTTPDVRMDMGLAMPGEFGDAVFRHRPWLKNDTNSIP